MKHLESALQQYRLLHTPTQLSVYQFWANQKFSNNDLFFCSPEEKEMFYNRLEESNLTFCKSVKDKQGQIGNLKHLIDIITNERYKNIKKLDRIVAYTSTNGVRPIGSSAFDNWGGFQVIDMDIKDVRFATILKEEIFKRLVKYNWFLGVAFSSSGKGLHIYTKIRVSESENADSKKKKLLYLTNFRHKYSFVYLACTKIIETLKNEDGSQVTDEQLLKWMDFAMFKPQQGAFIGYDEHPLINSNFFEDFIYVNFDNVEDMGHPDVDWVTYPTLKEAFKRWEWFEHEENEKTNINVENAPLLEIDSHNKYHYKHQERWKLANTLVKLYGIEQGFQYMRKICADTIQTKEIQADCQTAARHNKDIDLWAVKQLNKYHSFNIKLNIEQEEKELSTLYKEIEDLDNPTLIKVSPNTKRFYIKKNEYLGTIKNELLKNCGNITLIEAGAGVGKTEMVKSLVNDGKKILMVMPFTSTLESKVEGDKNWKAIFSNRKIRLDDTPGIAMTVDKFSRLNLLDVKECGFDYVFIDESHLLFQSEYRPVMSKVIDMIRNTCIPIIMMSGTPIGETVFFEDIVHLIVKKEDVRKKEFNVFLTEQPIDNLCALCYAMARDLNENKRVLFPTNKGCSFKDQVEELVGYFLKKCFLNDRKFNINYYKKSNLGEEFMSDVNFKKTVNKTDILMCSTYLSVGVDILDKFDFNIYFDELWMPQDVEQFANRLRGKDLFINVYLNKKNAQGESLNIMNFKPCNFELSADEIKDVHSLIRICNSMIERSPVEYKYNSLISSIINSSKYVEYNDIENKYYLNETAYKNTMFERKYREYVQQLPVLVKGMLSYGYEYYSEDLGEAKMLVSEDYIITDDVKEMLQKVRKTSKILKSAMVEELLEKITEDRLYIYKDALKGVFDIRKGDDWYEDELNKNMTVKDVEVFEKVVPLTLSLNKMYDIEDVKAIFESCTDGNGVYNFAEIQRVRTLASIIYNDKLERIDIPFKKFITDVYEFVDNCEGVTIKSNLEQFLIDCSIEYANNDSDDKIIIRNSPLTMKKIKEKLEQILKCLIKVSRPNKAKEVTLEIIELPWVDKNTKERDFLKNLGNIDFFLDGLNPRIENISLDDVNF